LTLGTESVRASLQWRYIGSVRDSQDAVVYATERLPEVNYFDLTISGNRYRRVQPERRCPQPAGQQPPLLPSSQNGGAGEQTNTFPTVYDVIAVSSS
jgi:hypothetical protein